MAWKYLAFGAVVLLAGCAAANTSGQPGERPLGYVFHDANHQGIGGTAQSSPEARKNAAQGTWLWPPEEADVP